MKAYSPDLTPIEEAFSKVKAALRTSAPCTVEAHSTAVWAALRTITPKDAAGWLAHAGYDPPPRPTRSARRRSLTGVLFRFPDPHPTVVLPGAHLDDFRSPLVKAAVARAGVRDPSTALASSLRSG